MRVAGNNNVVFAALRDRLWSDLDAVVDVVLDGDDRTVAAVARGELPSLVAGLQALLAQHVPDANGHCRQCRAGRWWRRTPVPCRALLEFQLARDNALTHRPRHRLTRDRTGTATRFLRCRTPRGGPPDTASAT
ncbi:hypothetical protein [Saccharothrix carnea]|uniref:hypothetical protein n=1 Tax=Saccharothrix carnea TaxID=1280637 RepID=UPI0011B25D51|nr:hypothetical protein [Saccharothrix carnea]